MKLNGILVVDHGSRLAAANDMIMDVADRLQTRMPQAIVRGVHMELAEPSIMDGFADLIKQGASEIVVVPFMLSPGRHSTKDIPNLAAEAAAANGNIPFRVASHFGEHDLIPYILYNKATEV